MGLKSTSGQSGGNLLNLFNTKDITDRVSGWVQPTKYEFPIGASGGNISNAEPGNGYVYHVFTSSGTFTISSIAGSATCNVDMLVVGAGGPTPDCSSPSNVGSNAGGGGGGIAHGVNYPLGVGSYTITVGDAIELGQNGVDSTFVASPTVTITAKGGGRGAAYQSPTTGQPGGSGGGGGYPGAAGGTATQPTQNPGIPQITNYGNAGGQAISPEAPNYENGGGGGAGAAGEPGSPTPSPYALSQGVGGAGQPFTGFAGPLFPTMPTAWIAEVATQGYYGGGGAGAGNQCPPHTGGVGGGADSVNPEPGAGGGANGMDNTGGGAGGTNNSPQNGAPGGSKGGKGIVIIRYAP